MNAEIFYNRIKQNDKLVNYIQSFKKETWKNLELTSKIDLIKDMFKEINKIYPEFGNVEFIPDFLFMSSGVSTDNKIYINIREINTVKDRFIVLQTIFHELGHFYQKSAYELYDRKKKINEIFNEEEIKKFKENNDSSKLSSVDNYLGYSYNSYLEYAIQPLEYETEKFSYDLVKLFENELFGEEDIYDIDYGTYDFEMNLREFKENKTDFVHFNRIYRLNYEDYVKDNKEYFIKDEIKSEIYYKNVERIKKLNLYETMCLFDYCFWKNYDMNRKKTLISRYLELQGFSFRVNNENNTLIINDKEVNSSDSSDVLEVIFNEMADEEIRRMLNKKDKLTRIEKEIVLNFNNNLIEEKDNPLFYNVQPYMLYKRNYVLRNFYDIYRVFDELHEARGFYFNDYEKYIIKYDIEPLMKKVEYLTDMKFDDFYDKMLEKMNKPRKTKR